MLETIRLLRRELDGRVPLIGFGGAPFTLAAYAIEGGPSKDYLRTKTFMYEQPASWHRLCALFADVDDDYLHAQVAAGAQALQIFDSWAGALGRADYREFVLPHTKRIFDGLADDRRAAHPLRRRRDGHPARPRRGRRRRDRRRLASASRRGVEDDRRDARHPGQPGSRAALRPARSPARRRRRHPARAGGRPGHIFNLGHGVLPQTPVENVQALADHVHARTSDARPSYPSHHSPSPFRFTSAFSIQHSELHRWSSSSAAASPGSRPRTSWRRAASRSSCSRRRIAPAGSCAPSTSTASPSTPAPTRCSRPSPRRSISARSSASGRG